MTQRKNRQSKAKSPKKRKNKVRIFSFKGLNGKSYRLTKRQKLFCYHFLTPNISGTEAAVRAGYATKKGKVNYVLAATVASENLRKPNVCAFITLRFKDLGITDELAEKHHLYTLTQYDNLSAKNKAIEMYYRKKGLFAPDKIEHSINERLEEFLNKQDKKLP